MTPRDYSGGDAKSIPHLQSTIGLKIEDVPRYHRGK